MRVTTSFGFLLAFVFMVPAGAWVSDYSILSDEGAAREITDHLGEGRVALSKLLRRPDAYVSGRMDLPPLFEGYGDFHFFFRGDTEAFNGFVLGYSSVPNVTHEVIIHPERITAPGPERVSQEKQKSNESIYDWHLYIPLVPDPTETMVLPTYIDVYLGGNIRLGDLRIPSNVSVRSGREIEKFVAENRKRQKAAPTDNAK